MVIEDSQEERSIIGEVRGSRATRCLRSIINSRAIDSADGETVEHNRPRYRVIYYRS